MDEPRKHTVILKRFFGLQPGQNLAQFAAECKQLSEAEKNELCDMIEAYEKQQGK